MPALHVRNVDELTTRRLKKREKKNARSFEAELRFILKQIVEQSTDDDEPDIFLTTVSEGSQSKFSRDDIYDDDGR